MRDFKSAEYAYELASLIL